MKKVGKLMEGGRCWRISGAQRLDERKRDAKPSGSFFPEYNRQMLAKGIFAKSFRQAAKRTATARRAFVAVALASAASLSQSKGETPMRRAGISGGAAAKRGCRQNSGRSQGAGEVTIATLLHGVVIPQDAVIPER